MKLLEETTRRVRERIQQIRQRGVLGGVSTTSEGPIRNIIKTVRETIQERLKRARSFQ